VNKKIIVSGLAVTLIAGISSVSIGEEGQARPPSQAAMLKTLQGQVARENEQAIVKPERKARQKTALNEDKNLYFGDTHIHTALSFDSYLSGNRLGLREAYRFANGEAMRMPSGAVMQISQPLDFVAVTDHAESFGVFRTCKRDDLLESQKKFCQKFESYTPEFYRKLRDAATQRPPKMPQEYCGGYDKALCAEDARSTWRQVAEMADEYNRPGEFTAFAAYEYSPSLTKLGKIHRNVIFKNSTVPKRAANAFDALTVLDLWRSLETECKGECEFLTIPHNMNKTWGIAYSGKTIDGDAYNNSDWALRGRSEPLAEIFQIKGSSECGFSVGASDEECNFELMVPICEGEQVAGCSGRTSFAREGLKIGMELEQGLGFNPLQFGFIGSTDTHNGNPGDTEESDFRGAQSLAKSSAVGRLGYQGGNSFKPLSIIQRVNPGGLAAVWARENSRDAIFEAMENREAYATSGTRIKLRFFAGWDFEKELITDPELVHKAYRGGVPMGSVLPRKIASKSPEFLVWAMKDGSAASLQRVQMIKGWVEEGKSREQVFDIACSDGLSPDAKTGRCPDNGAKVDIATCAVSADKGDSQIKVSWNDPDFNPDQAAFYYIRVLENPSCRWSSYDAIRLGIEPRTDIVATVQQRAWSSPIWYTP